MINLINVSKSYNKKEILKNVNLNINKSGIYTFIGDNGCGKTTLLNMIAKIIKPSKGKVINKLKGYSFISQNVNLLNHLTIKEHFSLFKVDENNLKKVRLYNKLNSYPTQLSQGQRQRIVCILSLYSTSSLVIADEPTSHLDSKNASLIIKELIKVSKSKIILLVSHDYDLIENYSNKIYKIEDKQVKLFKDNGEGKKIENNKKNKINFSKYIKKSLKFYKKINLLFKFIFILSFVLILFSFNFKNNVKYLLNDSISNTLDYNKFYLKQCEKIEKEVTFKKCRELSEDKINILKNKNYKVGYNYDLLLNSLYDVDKFNVINNEGLKLKEGRYPSKYDEIIVNDNYNINDTIELSTSKVISIDKTDIYNKSIKLKVVGIVNKSILNNKDNYYLDYDLVEKYLKEEYLINNKKTLFDYFLENQFNDYKHILFFDNIDFNILKDNEIDYLSSSYDYYESVNEIIEQVNKCFIYLTIVVVSLSIYYLMRLIIKKVKYKEKEILFLKSMSVNKKNIIKIINKEQKQLILKSYLISFLLMIFLFYAFFKTIKIRLINSLLVFFLSLIFNKKILKIAINKRIRV